ncbi:adhesion G protein-coupled receptor E2-like isoform X2 [Dysidea avara]|uniref:adhesion G protein-coupled receptor E2-like isoform X2 n=1 Tax=Dysidea avara TaxID=196820 RepID=UPI00332C9378
MTLGRLLVAILIELGLYVGALERGETVDCLIDFNIYISQDGQFCNGTDHVDSSLTHPVYFQYKTGIDWTTLGSYNESILLEKLEFTVSNETASNVHFRWVQHNTVASPAWAVDDIIINCSQVFLTISFEEVSSELVRRLECHSGSVQSAADNCSDTEFSLVLSGTERELRTTNLNLLNQMDNSNNEFYNTCAVTCPPLTAPGNGTMNCSSSDDGAHYVGDICTYTCNSGFVLNDTDNRKCQNDGSWNSTEPFCDQECTTNGYDVVFVLDISVSIQKNVLVGSIRNFTTRVVSFLDIGLTRSLVGLMYFAGDARVVFDLQQYRSKHTLTSALKEIDYPKEKGTKYIPILHLLNATAHSDSIGFRPDYPNIAIILTEGKSKDEPRTLRREAKKFHMEQLYQLFAVGIGNADQDQLDTITGDPSMVFLVDNLDEPALEQLEKNLSQQLCKNRISCPSFTAPNNGMIDCTGNMFEDTCTFSCDHGYELSGSKTLTCQSDQTWNGTDVMCTPVSCQQFTTAPNNGIINCTGNIFEDTCTFSCNQGYELSGSEKRTCQSYKFWNGTKVMCTKVSCPSLTAPNNGMINCTGNMFEDTCTFSCDQGYELSGSETRTCQSNTTWNGTDVMCTPVSCQQLATAPNNGMIDCTGNMFEDTCTFSCDQGYELNGSENRTCRSDKIWSGTEAMCTKVSCPSLTAPNNGMIDYTGNMSEDTCTFSSDPANPVCQAETDKEFGIEWPGAIRNKTVMRCCPNGTGCASRLCNSSGKWEVANVKKCWSVVYQELEKNSSLLVNSSDEALPGMAHKIQTELAKLVTPGSYSIFPLDLKSVNVINRNILDAVENNTDTLNMDGFINTSVGLHSNLLHSSNKPGYLQLMEVNRTENQQLIVITERLGILLASNINSTIGNNSMKFKEKNLAISVEKRNASNLETVSYIGVENDAAIIIPASVIKERSETCGDKMVPIAHIEYTNIEDYLPRNLSMPNKGVPVSSVISSQVGNSTMPMSSDEPIILMLPHNAENITGANVSTLRCVFWNFTLTQNGVTGGWDTNNVVVVDVNDTFITCNSTHLTSFAVLVDVTGGTSKQSKEEATALKIVSYIGCSVSIVCSVIAICLLLIYRNTILKGTHNFTHLNLAIALLLSLLVFVGGIEGGTYNKVVCTVVAALLHYLFTAVFSWMLCEGILLYVFLVKVFNLGSFTKKKLYFIFGWGIPVPIVAISVGIAHDHYGTDEFCWISTDDGTIWAFAGPMLLIVTVNTVILFMVFYVLYKTKSQKMRADTAKRIAVVKSLLKATVVLLPLLGLTWVFGLLAVNKNTSVFAWLFTVLNSLQGLFLLSFHVIRNDKVRARIKKIFGFKEPTSTVFTNRRPYMSKKVIREVTSKKTRNLSNGTNQSQSVDKPDCNNFSERV